jgi:hypothetical protein
VITQGSGPMYQRGEHSLFIGRVVVGVGMEIEVGMCGFMVDYGPMSHRVCGIYRCLGRVGGGDGERWPPTLPRHRYIPRNLCPMASKLTIISPKATYK